MARELLHMRESIKSILNGVVVVATVLWLLKVFFGMFHYFSKIYA